MSGEPTKWRISAAEEFNPSSSTYSTGGNVSLLPSRTEGVTDKLVATSVPWKRTKSRPREDVRNFEKLKKEREKTQTQPPNLTQNTGHKVKMRHKTWKISFGEFMACVLGFS